MQSLQGGDEAGACVALRNVFVHVTKACNLACRYCYMSARRPLPDELRTDEYGSLWPDLVRIGPAKVTFTGGEPLLRTDLLALIGALRAADPAHRIVRCLNSNGHLLTPSLARQLVGLADEVRISIDALEARNDAQRGTGNFAAALRALEIYLDLGFETKVLVTVTRASIDDLDALVRLLRGRGVRYIKVNRFRPIGRGTQHADWAVDRVAVDRALTGVQQSRSSTTASGSAGERVGGSAATTASPARGERHTCGVGQFVNIQPNGDVFPCHVLTAPEFRCGNLRQESLLAICARARLLGRLADLDFPALVQADPKLAALTAPDSCLGEVHARTKSSAAWQRLAWARRQ